MRWNNIVLEMKYDADERALVVNQISGGMMRTELYKIPMSHEEIEGLMEGQTLELRGKVAKI